MRRIILGSACEVNAGHHQERNPADGPVQFDGTYQIAGWLAGGSYTVYAEALNGAADPSQLKQRADVALPQRH